MLLSIAKKPFGSPLIMLVHIVIWPHPFYTLGTWWELKIVLPAQLNWNLPIRDHSMYEPHCNNKRPPHFTFLQFWSLLQVRGCAYQATHEYQSAIQDFQAFLNLKPDEVCHVWWDFYSRIFFLDNISSEGSCYCTRTMPGSPLQNRSGHFSCWNSFVVPSHFMFLNWKDSVFFGHIPPTHTPHTYTTHTPTANWTVRLSTWTALSNRSDMCNFAERDDPWNCGCTTNLVVFWSLFIFSVTADIVAWNHHVESVVNTDLELRPRFWQPSVMSTHSIFLHHTIHTIAQPNVRTQHRKKVSHHENCN